MKGTPTTSINPEVITVETRNPFTPADGVNIYNNTINFPKQTYTNTDVDDIRVTSGARNTDIRNNLIIRPTGNNIEAVDDEGVNTTQFNNLFVDDGGFVDDSSSIPQDRDYRLTVTSPALNTGITNNHVLDDYNGNFRDSNQYNVDAYEQ